MSSADFSGNTRREHAVVIGASIAGLLAARALSDTFTRVTVIDRDVVPDRPHPRGGVPQGEQAHLLLARGRAVLEELLPGISDELLARGAIGGDVQNDFRWYLDGYQLAPAPSGLTTLALSRPLIEHVVRARVMGLPGVELIDSTDVLGLIADDRQVVTGVRLKHRFEDGDEWTLATNLVVDASGRSSRAPVWLDELGYPRPSRSRVRPDVVCVTRHYRREPQHLDGRVGAGIAAFPGQPRAGLVLRQEGDRLAVLLTGLLGEDPPTDDDGLLAFAEGLAGPEVADIIRSATPLDYPVKLRYPTSVRHHYEKLDRFLGGFLVLGDALCCFNPVYGLGMSVAALEAQALQRILAPGGSIDDLPRRFFTTAAKLIDTPWRLATAGDLRFPAVKGKRRPLARLLNGYLHRYRGAASLDPALGASLLRVANLIEPPARLLKPGEIVRVFGAFRAGRPNVVQPPRNAPASPSRSGPAPVRIELPAASSSSATQSRAARSPATPSPVSTSPVSPSPGTPDVFAAFFAEK